MIGAFLQRKGRSRLLAAALKDQTIRVDAAVIGQRAIGASGQPHEALAAALAAAAKITAGPRQLNPEEMSKMVASVKDNGDPARGEAIFRRAELQCLKCTRSETPVARRSRTCSAWERQLRSTTSLIAAEPRQEHQRGVPDRCRADDRGKVLSGVKLRQSDTDLIIRDAEDKRSRFRSIRSTSRTTAPR